ncbi:hypothetical protein [Deinococcus soli (ex Cha et al. 2016)]|uniref:Uncharacterized protein n=1 Tax=Deinococcus soli (ex Cha et al. 2016) TaxID=1309411 RepID=A0ACC6KQJ6_9DEIO|nr:hypothetical protein [Deinococcus soli (ex Cha et al. 2016)]MDR6330616.1 hypothetical protein [Deinococcus soli (ex Cha et al. 2016)]MDR6754703.1 hypothetical protein [Deinococcus soli (ex Cha et al. 2016)]
MRNQIYVPPGVHVLPISPLADNGLSGFQITGSSGPAVTLEWRAADPDPWLPLTLPVTLAPGLLRLTRTDESEVYACLNGEYTAADGTPPGDSGGGGGGVTWAPLTEIQRTDQGDGTVLVSFEIPAAATETAYVSALRGVTGGAPLLFEAYPGTPSAPGLIAVGQWAATNGDVGQGSGYALAARVDQADLGGVTSFEAELTPYE